MSIKMAKEQSLSLNPTKISGTCGRLMCCLKYEQDAYEELLKKAPNVGALVDTPVGRGTVIASQLLKGIVSVKIDNSDTVVNDFKVEDIVIIKNTQRTAQKEEVDAKALAELEKD